MKDVCFFTVYDRIYKKIGKSCVASIKRFYPEIDVIEYELPRAKDTAFDLQGFCKFHLEKGKELLEQYERIISVDTDHVMCNYCPDLFDDYDFGIVENNMTMFGDHYPVYFNAGLTVCSNKFLWDEWVGKYDYYTGQWIPYTEQNTLNDLYYQYKDKYNFKVLEFDDRSYGIKDMEGYGNMYLRNHELYVNNKRLCMIHFAGNEWISGVGIKWSLFNNKDALRKLQFLIQ